MTRAHRVFTTRQGLATEGQMGSNTMAHFGSYEMVLYPLMVRNSGNGTSFKLVNLSSSVLLAV